MLRPELQLGDGPMPESSDVPGVGAELRCGQRVLQWVVVQLRHVWVGSGVPGLGYECLLQRVDVQLGDVWNGSGVPLVWDELFCGQRLLQRAQLQLRHVRDTADVHRAESDLSDGGHCVLLGGLREAL